MALLAFFPTIMEIKKTVTKWILFVIFIILASIGGYANYLVENQEQIEREEQRKEDQRKSEESVKHWVHIFTKKELNTKDLEEITSLLYKDIYHSSEKDAKKWAQDVLSSSPEEQEEMKSLSARGEELGNRLRLQWRPLYTYILKAFDDRITELQNRNKNLIKSSFKDDTKDIVLVENVKQQYSLLREVQFQHGNAIRIYMLSARIQGGQLLDSPYIVINQDVNGARDNPFRLNFSTREYWLYHYNEPYHTTKGFLEDKDFHDKITSAINKILKFVVYEEIQTK